MTGEPRQALLTAESFPEEVGHGDPRRYSDLARSMSRLRCHTLSEVAPTEALACWELSLAAGQVGPAEQMALADALAATGDSSMACEEWLAAAHRVRESGSASSDQVSLWALALRLRGCPQESAQEFVRELRNSSTEGAPRGLVADLLRE